MTNSRHCLRPDRFATDGYEPRQRESASAGLFGDVVLMLGNYRHTLTAARQLSRQGFTVILGMESGTSCCEYSRYVDQVWQCPPFIPGSAEFLAALRDLIDRQPRPVTIMPMGEWPLETIASFEAELAPLARLAMPEARILSILHDKYRSLVFARNAGLHIPPFALAHDLKELAHHIAEIGCPVVMRTIVSGTRIGRNKAVTVRNLSELDRAFPAWPDGVPALLIQRLFTGKRVNVYFAAQDGHILAEQHSWSLRTDRVDGTGQTIEGITTAPVASVSRELALIVQALNYTGVGNAQFLYDEGSGKPCFLEINARFGASYAFIEHIGMGLTRLAWDLAWNDPATVAARDNCADEGTYFVWSLGDITGLLFALQQRTLTAGQATHWVWRALLAAVRSDVHVTWSLRDPMPTLMLYTHTLGKALGLLRRRPAPRLPPSPRYTVPSR